MDPSPCSMPLSEIFLGQQLSCLNAQHSPGLPGVPGLFSECSPRPRKGSCGGIPTMPAELAAPYPSILRSGDCCPNPKGIDAQSLGLHAHPQGPQVCMPTPRVLRSACPPPGSPGLHAYPPGPPLEGAGDSRARQAQAGSPHPAWRLLRWHRVGGSCS